MQTSDVEVTARIYRTEEGEVYHGYRVGGVEYGSLDALTTALEGM